MWLDKFVHIIDVAARVSAKVTNIIAAGFLFILMLFTCSDVLLRYLFNKPILGSIEITEFIMAIIVSFSLANCALQKGHVRVDLLGSRLSERAQIVMNSLAYFAFLGLFALITWRIVPRAMEMMEFNQVGLISRIPVPPFVLLVAVGTAVLCIVQLKNLLDVIRKGSKK